MDSFTEIRDTLTHILSNHRFDEISSHALSAESANASLSQTAGQSASPAVDLSQSAHKLLSQMEGKDKAVERLYLFYYLSEIVRHMTSCGESQQFISTLFASPLNQRQASLMSQLISLALSLRNEELLNCTARYVMHSDRICLSNDVRLEPTLATDSPQFCAAFISKGYFVGNGITKRQLSHWLNTLVEVVDQNLLILNSSIRFSLLDGPIESGLHLAILTAIESRKCQPLSNQFVVDLATVISQKTHNEELVDRFAQIVIIAHSCQMCSQSNQMKSILVSKFPNNLLIKAICK